MEKGKDEMTIRKVLRRVVLGVLLGAIVSVGTASAQTAEQKRAAKEHFEKARRLYDVGRYQDAIEEYQKAYLNVEDPVFLYNIAQAYRLNEQAEEAIRFYKNYLRRAPDAPNRADVEDKIADLQRELEARERTVTPPPPAEPVVPASPPPVVTQAPPTFEPPPPRVAPPTEPVSATPVESVAPDRWRTTGIILAGAGGVLLVTSVVTGSMANKAAKDVEKQLVFDPDVESRGKALDGVAVVTGLLGVVAGVSGAVLLFSSRSAPAEAAAPSASAPPRLALTPVVGRTFTGAEATIRF